MALTQAQRSSAQLIMGLARQQGLSPARARELVAVAMAESGLNPRSVNRSSGAAGLFQLLSSGYVSRAKQLGGVFNPTANVNAILPDYVRYWRQNPSAAPGAAGRDVERSGMGAEFYARPLSGLGDIGAGGGVPASSPAASGPSPLTTGTQPNFADIIRNRLLGSLRGGRAPDWMGLAMLAARGRRAGPAAPRVDAPPTDRNGNFVDPVSGKVIGTPYHGTHTLGNWESDRAIDVAVPVGSPVRAPFAGTVGSQFGSLGASSGSRFAGLRLHIGNPQNEWYGAHLSKFAPGIRPGARVRPGQIIGYSGSASGVAHLHEALRSGDPYSLVR